MNDFFDKSKRLKCPGNTAEITKNHHDWLTLVTDEMLTLRAQVKEFREEIKTRGHNIEELDKSVSELEMRPTVASPVSLSAIMQEQASEPSAGIANFLWTFRQETAVA